MVLVGGGGRLAMWKAHEVAKQSVGRVLLGVGLREAGRGNH